MVDAIDSKSINRKVMRVRVPPSAQIRNSLIGNFFVPREGLERQSATARVGVEQIFTRKLCVTEFLPQSNLGLGPEILFS